MKLELYSKKISLFKTISWRILAGLDTTLIAFLLTGNIAVAAQISSLEVLTKFFLFYAHERVWNKIHQSISFFKDVELKRNSWIKACSWRLIGSLDTVVISFFVTQATQTALLIGLVELISKIIFYFFHERFWIWLIHRFPRLNSNNQLNPLAQQTN